MSRVHAGCVRAVERLLREAGQPRRRRVEKMHRVPELPEMMPHDEPVGQRFGREGRIGGQRTRDHLAQRLLRETRGGRIDGREPVRQRRVRLDHLELRMHDLVPEVAVAHFAEHADAAAGGERLLLVRIEMEEAQHELRPRAAIVAPVLQQTDELAPRPVLDVGRDDRAFGLLLDTRLQRRQRHDPRVVLVAQRQVQHQILVADEAEPDELVVEAARRRSPHWRRLVRRGFCRRHQIGDGRLRASGAACCRRFQVLWAQAGSRITTSPIIDAWPGFGRLDTSPIPAATINRPDAPLFADPQQFDSARAT